jgi:hypothetical protein
MGTGIKTDHELLADYASPIRSGWALWGRSLRPLVVSMVPLAVIMGIIVVLLPETDPEAELTLAEGLGSLTLLALFAYSFALVQVVLSQQYVGLVRGNLYLWTLRRFLPWCLASTIVGMLALAGFLLFVVPGVYLSLRLCWVGEFALVHRFGPLQSIRESWRLTKDNAGSIFKFQFLAGLAANLILFAGAIVITGLAAVIELAGSHPFLDPVGGTVVWLAFLVGYGAFEGPEVIYFYGMRAEQAVSLAESRSTFDLRPDLPS